MLQNSYDNYTQKPQLNAKLKVLRKIIAFVFAINMLITRFFGGPAGTQLRQAEVFTDSSASQTYVTDSVYSTDLPSILSAEDFDTSVTASQSSVYNNLVGDVYNDVFGYAAGFTLFTEGDCNVMGADSGGRIAVGGDFTGPGWYDINHQDPNRNDPNGCASLIVGGTLNNFCTNNGNVWANNIGENYSNSNYKTVIGGVNSDDCKFNFADTFAYLRSSSAHLAGLQANGVYNGAYGNITLDGYDKGVNIFTIDMYTWNSMAGNGGYALNINVPEGSTILINITGGEGDSSTSLNLAMHSLIVNGHHLQNNEQTGNLLFNVTNAATININGFNGSILAPNSDINGGGWHHDGNIVCKSFSGNTEFGSNPFNPPFDDDDFDYGDDDTDTDTDTDTETETDTETDTETETETEKEK